MSGFLGSDEEDNKEAITTQGEPVTEGHDHDHEHARLDDDGAPPRVEGWISDTIAAASETASGMGNKVFAAEAVKDAAKQAAPAAQQAAQAAKPVTDPFVEAAAPVAAPAIAKSSIDELWSRAKENWKPLALVAAGVGILFKVLRR